MPERGAATAFAMMLMLAGSQPAAAATVTINAKLQGDAIAIRASAMLNTAMEFKGNKSYLPNKSCAACGRVMTWRKSWAKNWESVEYCSEPCRRARSKSGDQSHP